MKINPAEYLELIDYRKQAENSGGMLRRELNRLKEEYDMKLYKMEKAFEEKLYRLENKIQELKK